MWTFFFACLFTFSLAESKQDDYFFHQVTCTAEELSTEINSKTLDMCWRFGPDSHFRFLTSNDAIYFEVCLGTLPDIYDDFLMRAKSKCLENNSQENNLEENNAQDSGPLIFSYK